MQVALVAACCTIACKPPEKHVLPFVADLLGAWYDAVALPPLQQFLAESEDDVRQLEPHGLLCWLAPGSDICTVWRHTQALYPTLLRAWHAHRQEL